MVDRSDSLIDSEVLKAALACAKRGWRVFPVPPGTKKSYKSEQHSGTKWGATSNPVAVARDFTNPRFPNPGIGLATGAESAVLVVDADTLEGHSVDGVGNLARLVAENGGEWPATLQARSPSASDHYFFAWPLDGLDVKSRNSKIVPGVDVKASGGIVVLAPTRTDKGQYAWVNDLPLAQLPAWFLALARRENYRGSDDEYSIEFADGDGESTIEFADVDLDKIAFAMAELPNETIEGATNETDPRHFDRDDWLAICMALHHEFGDDPRGFAIFDSWSAKWKH